VEQKYKDPFSITPRAKICWALNDLPRVGDANSGLFRRVKVVLFPRLNNEPDRGLKDKVKAEGAGILNWALEGLERLKERGTFEIPACVREATADFQQTNDIPALFVNEACLGDMVEEVQASELYKAYTHWCELNGHKPQSATTVAREWRRLGFEKRTKSGRIFYDGLTVKPGWPKKYEGNSLINPDGSRKTFEDLAAVWEEEW
jgi:putative DNA primase/helicase